MNSPSYVSTYLETERLKSFSSSCFSETISENLSTVLRLLMASIMFDIVFWFFSISFEEIYDLASNRNKVFFKLLKKEFKFEEVANDEYE